MQLIEKLDDGCFVAIYQPSRRHFSLTKIQSARVLGVVAIYQPSRWRLAPPCPVAIYQPSRRHFSRCHGVADALHDVVAIYQPSRRHFSKTMHEGNAAEQQSRSISHHAGISSRLGVSFYIALHEVAIYQPSRRHFYPFTSSSFPPATASRDLSAITQAFLRRFRDHRGQRQRVAIYQPSRRHFSRSNVETVFSMTKSRSISHRASISPGFLDCAGSAFNASRSISHRAGISPPTRWQTRKHFSAVAIYQPSRRHFSSSSASALHHS